VGTIKLRMKAYAERIGLKQESTSNLTSLSSIRQVMLHSSKQIGLDLFLGLLLPGGEEDVGDKKEKTRISWLRIWSFSLCARHCLRLLLS